MKAYSKLGRWKLRQFTAIRGMSGARPRIIFNHVPKTAGTTIRAHLRACLGSQNSGRAVRVADIPFTPPLEPKYLKAGLMAHWVYGHMGWDSFEQLDPGNAFTFTFLRSPEARLKSLYVFLASYPQDVKDPLRGPVLKILRGLSASEIARLRDPLILARADNYMVRQFSGSVQRYPLPASEWPVLLDKAIRNLKSLDFIGRQENFREDFSRLLSMLNLPQHRSMALNSRNSAKAKVELDPRLYEWDQKLFAAFLNSELNNNLAADISSRSSARHFA